MAKHKYRRADEEYLNSLELYEAIPKDTLFEYLAIFRVIDDDGSGCISERELQEAFRTMGIQLSKVSCLDD